MKNLSIAFILVTALMARILFAQVIHIAYTGNLNGTLEPCFCDGNDRGGILQVKNAVDSLFKVHPAMILLDSGDFLKSFPLAAANTLMFEFMSQTGYSAVALGEQELVEGNSFFQYFQNRLSLPLICTNLDTQSRSERNIQSHKIVTTDGISIGIVALLFPGCFDYIVLRDMDLLEVDQSLKTALELLRGKTDLIVLLCHENYREGLSIAERYPEIKIIIAGHSQEKTEIRYKGQIVVQPGFDGENLGLLTVEKVNGNFNVTNQFIAIDSRSGSYLPFKEKVSEAFP